jgi:hypothetical protein
VSTGEAASVVEGGSGRGGPTRPSGLLDSLTHVE